MDETMDKLAKDISGKIESLRKDLEAKGESFEKHQKTIDDLVKNWSEIDEYKAKIEKSNQALELMEKKFEDFKKSGGVAAPTAEAFIKKINDEKGNFLKLFSKNNKQDAQAFQKELIEGNLLEKGYATSNGADGGYLVPSMVAGELLKEVTEYSPVRDLVKTTSISIAKIEQMVRPAQSKRAMTKAERAALPNDVTKKMRQVILNSATYVGDTSITREMLNYSSYDVWALVRDDLAEAFSLRDSYGFFLGRTGTSDVGGMEGLHSKLGTGEGKINSIKSGAANAINYETLVTLLGEVKSAYKSGLKWVFNRRTLAKMMLLKDPDNHYIWQPNAQLGAPSTLLGIPYVICDDSMDDIADGKFPIFLGDFKKAYWLNQSMGYSMIVDEYTAKEQLEVEIVAYDAVASKILLPEAIKAYEIGA